MRSPWLLLGLLVIGACGEEEGNPQPQPPPPGGNQPQPPPPAAGAPTAAANPNGKKKIEDLVSKEEEATIRHTFKDRDFLLDENNRDPFQSFVLTPPETNNDKLPQDITSSCVRDDQFVASTYSYTDLKLVGIVAERTQKKVLMMGGRFGYLIKKGDCVGREKAVVKDIGTGYITFQVAPEVVGGQQRDVEEHSVQLYPNQVPLATQPRVIDSPRSNAPVVSPNAAPVQSPTNVPVQSPSTAPVEAPPVVSPTK
jgi:hypothetical protein